MKRVIVIGAGIGGLTTAALLAKAGLDVTVLEAHVYPGGCAGTFYHQGYRFEAGATLAGGFYPGGPMDLVAQAVGIGDWHAHAEDLAMQVHLPDGSVINRWKDHRSIEEDVVRFGPKVENFWRWQQATADSLWNLALRLPPWPAQSVRQFTRMVGSGFGWLPANFRPNLLLDAVRPLSVHLQDLPDLFKLYIDAQLLISAQATSDSTYAVYGASALDLPRRGVVHLQGGIGSIAKTLAEALKQNGGRILYRNEVRKLKFGKDRIIGVETKRGEVFQADLIAANLPPWNIAQLINASEESPKIFSQRLANLSPAPQTGWGAFVAYLGIDQSVLPVDFPVHHQIISGRPLGEGNSIFFSISPAWDKDRAPDGQRAVTISTHTDLASWWKLFAENPIAYENRKEEYLERLITTAEKVIPGLSGSIRFSMGGTPITFQRFTRRAYGWVGGFPQTSLFETWGPRLAKNIWMVGDSIFPGQSIAAVALGGLRVANDILEQIG